MPDPVITPDWTLAGFILMYSSSHLQPNSKAYEFVMLFFLWLCGSLVGQSEPGNRTVPSGFGVQHANSILSQFIQYLRTAFLGSAPPVRFISAPIFANRTVGGFAGSLANGQQIPVGQYLIANEHDEYGPPLRGCTPHRSEHLNDAPFWSDNRICRKKLLLTKGSRPALPSLKMANSRNCLSKTKNMNAQSGISFSEKFGALCRAYRPRL